MRLASFNVENLFARAKVLNTATWAEGQPQLAAFERFNRTAQRRFYRKVDKEQMLRDLETLSVIARASSNGRLIRQPNVGAQMAILRENRGDFMIERRKTGIEIVATGRASWIGWLELAVESVDEVAIEMTAKVIRDLAAGVLAVVEAEHRPSLVRFNEAMLANRYRHVMLVDGNDQRGIDVGLLTTASRPIVRVESHVDDRDTKNTEPLLRTNRLFSRDAPVFTVRCGSEDLFVVVNHLKSQSPTGSEPPDDLRTRQSTRLAAIYRRLAPGRRHLRRHGRRLQPRARRGRRTSLAGGTVQSRPRPRRRLQPAAVRPRPAAGHVPVVQPARPPRLHLPVTAAG